MIDLYDVNDITKLEAKQKKRSIFLWIFNSLVFITSIVLFFFIDRSNYIYMSIIISLLLFYISAITFFYCSTVFFVTKREISFLKYISVYDTKINHINGIQIKDEMVNKHKRSFYIFTYEVKDKVREGYIDKRKLDLIKSYKVTKIGMNDRILTCFDGEKDD